MLDKCPPGPGGRSPMKPGFKICKAFVEKEGGVQHGGLHLISLYCLTVNYNPSW